MSDTNTSKALNACFRTLHAAMPDLRLIQIARRLWPKHDKSGKPVIYTDDDITNVVLRGHHLPDPHLVLLVANLNLAARQLGLVGISVEEIRQGKGFGGEAPPPPRPTNGQAVARLTPSPSYQPPPPRKPKPAQAPRPTHSIKLGAAKPTANPGGVSTHAPQPKRRGRPPEARLPLLPERLTLLIQQAGHTPTSFCRSLGITSGNYTHWRKNKCCPPKVAKALGVPPEELMQPLSPEDHAKLAECQQKHVSFEPERLYLERLRRGLTILKVAEALGCSDGAVNQWLKEKKGNPKLLQFLGLDAAAANTPLTADEVAELAELKHHELRTRRDRWRQRAKEKEAAHVVPATPSLTDPPPPKPNTGWVELNPTLWAMLLAVQEVLRQLTSFERQQALEFLRHE